MVLSASPIPPAALFRLSRQVEKAKIDYCEITCGDRIVLKHEKNGHSAVRLHKINSVTKSVLALLIGIAIDRKQLESVSVPLTEFFPDLRGVGRELTVEHLLTMTTGWDWREWGDWDGLPKPMTDSPDWVRFIIERPIVDPPGTRMVYNSGCSHLLSAVLQQAAGMPTAVFAEKHLFGPMGITQFHWPSDPQGVAIGGFGMEMLAAYMHKLGLLMLGNGRFEGQTIVPAAWVAQCVQPRFFTYGHVGCYGYHWWVLSDENGSPLSPAAYFAMGYGGQHVFVVPELELVATFASSLYKQSQTFLPFRLFRELYRELLLAN